MRLLHFATVICTLSVLLTATAPQSVAQEVAAGNRYERIYVKVPMVGKGTKDDPMRPMFAPKRSEVEASGLLSFRYVLSDDRKTALMELVAADRKAFTAMFDAAAKREDVKVFEKGIATKAEIEAAFKQVKPTFEMDKFSREGK